METVLELTPPQLRAVRSGARLVLPIAWPMATQGQCPPEARVDMDGPAAIVRSSDGRELLRLMPPVSPGLDVTLTDGDVEILASCRLLEVVQTGAESGELPRPRTPAQWAWAIGFDIENFPQGKVGAIFSTSAKPQGRRSVSLRGSRQ